MTDFTTRPEIRATFGAVATTHWIASAIGMSVLERGDNAFDAAVTAGFVLQIIEPHRVGTGRRGADHPQGVRRIGAGGDLRAGTLSGGRDARALRPARVAAGAGHRAVACGGAGRIRRVDAAAARLRRPQPRRGARAGDRVCGDRVSAGAAGGRIDPCREGLVRAEWPASAAVRLPHGDVPRPRSLMRTPATTATYRRIVAEAASARRDRIAQI